MPLRRTTLLVASIALLFVGGLGIRSHSEHRAGAVPIGAGATDHVIDHGGQTRTYRVYRPHERPGPAPLVVMLHGGFGSGEQAQRAYGWNAEADAAGFVVAYPDGAGRTWNTSGDCCGASARDNVDDVGFLTAMIDEIGQSIEIDRDRIYVAGMSNGAIMAYTMACRTSFVAAIGAVAGTQLGACGNPAPTSVIHVHGTDDANIRYDGAPGRGIARIDGPPIAEVEQHWRAVNECAPPESETSAAVSRTTAHCGDDRTVALVTVRGAGHQWPGSDSSPALEMIGADPPSGEFDATAEIWAFFAAHRR
ncbi:PHB depolymerase family esterase [Nocardia fluminea]